MSAALSLVASVIGLTIGGLASALSPIDRSVAAMSSTNILVSSSVSSAVSGDAVVYMIVTSETFAPAFEPLLAWKLSQGVAAQMATVESIYPQYPQGVDDPERIRLFLRDAYNDRGLETVLIGGSPAVVPIRYGHSWVWNFYEGGDEIPTDQYYACLDGNWNANGNSRYGEGIRAGVNPISDETDLVPELRVSRLPAHDAAEVDAYLRKYFAYLSVPSQDGGFQRALMLGEVIFDSGWQPGDCDECGGCPDGERCARFDGAEECFGVIDALHTSVNPYFFPIELYERDYWWIPRGHPHAGRLNRASLARQLKLGSGVVFHFGRGDSAGWDIGTDRFTALDLVESPAGQARARSAGFVYSAASYTAKIDAPCVASAWLFAPMIGALIYDGSASLDFPVGQRFYYQKFLSQWPGDGSKTPLDAHQYACEQLGVLAGDNDNVARWIVYSQTFLGEPDLQIYSRSDPFAPTGGSSKPTYRSTSSEVGGRTTTPFGADPATILGSESWSFTPIGDVVSHGPVRVRLDVPRESEVTIEALDVTGRSCRVLLERRFPAGIHELVWDGRNASGASLPAGVYFLRASSRSLGSRSLRVLRLR